MPWITTKSGKKVNTDWFDKDRQIADNKKEAEKLNGTNLVKASHITKGSNVDNILRHGFDLSKAGSGAGSVWGDGIYFLQNDLERTFYSYRLDSKDSIEATIDTSDMIRIDLEGSFKLPKLYDEVSKQLPQDLQKAYRSSARKSRDKHKALIDTIKSNYSGMIFNQENKAGLDIVTGGSQIVVYDIKAIKKVKRGK